MQTQNGDWWATFLATRPYADDYYNIGRETFLLPVTWKDGWPIILEHGKTVPWTVAKPRLPASPTPKLPTSGDFGYTDEFDGTGLAMQWIGVRTPRTPFYTVANGTLRLNGRAPLGDRKGVPGFVGRRQQHAIADVSTTVTFAPARDGARAGLVAMQNDSAYLFFGVTRIDGQPRIALYTRSGTKTRDETAPEILVSSAPLNAKAPVTLSLHARGGTMAFDYQVGGKTMTLKSDLDTRFLSTARAGGFVGTVIGPYAYTPQ